MKRFFCLRLFLFSFTFFLSSFLLAAITVSSITGASRFTNDGSSINVYGGMAGAVCTPLAGEQVCDSCIGSNLTACNRRKIIPNGLVRIYFSSSDKDGIPFIQDKDGGSVTQSGPTTTVSQGTQTYVELTWSEICGQATDDSASCANPFPISDGELTIGISDGSGTNLDEQTIKFSVAIPEVTFPNGNGHTTSETAITNATADGLPIFTTNPGDAKAIINDPQGHEGFPAGSNSGPIYIYARFIFSPTSYATATAENAVNGLNGVLFADIRTSSEKRLETSTINGLENNTLYFVRSSLVDEALNWVFFIDNTQIDSKADCNSTDTSATPLTDEQIANCPYTVKPDEVIGLLEDDLNCFVATASYGSTFHPKVNDLRIFRDKILAQFSLGQSFIKWYYKEGPKAALWITNHPKSKIIVRSLLWPIWATSQFMLFTQQYPLTVFLTILFSLLFLYRRKLPLKILNKHLLPFLVLLAFMMSTSQSKSFAQDMESDEEVISELDDIEIEEMPVNEEDEFADIDQSDEAEEDGLPEDFEENTVDNELANESNQFNSEDVQVLNNGISPQDLKVITKGSKDTQKINHPNSKKGLYLIDENRSYYYKTSGTPKEHTISVVAGLASYNDLVGTTGISFEQIYGDSQLTQILVAYEWDLFESFGKMKFKAGTGISFISGNGLFVNNLTIQASESFTLLIFPSTASLVYKFKYWDKQWLVPYIEGGGDILPLMETRDDQDLPKFGGGLGAHFAAGLALSLRLFSEQAMVEFDSEYGINDLWFTFEMRQVIGLSSLDMTALSYNAGLTVDY